MKNQSRQRSSNIHRRSPSRRQLLRGGTAFSWRQRANHFPPWILAFGVCLAAYVDSHHEWFRKEERRSKKVIRRTIYLSKRAAHSS